MIDSDDNDIIEMVVGSSSEDDGQVLVSVASQEEGSPGDSRGKWLPL